jgi:hypothetical protein
MSDNVENSVEQEIAALKEKNEALSNPSQWILSGLFQYSEFAPIDLQ